MSFCPACSAEVRANARFCPNCGAPQQEAAPGEPASPLKVKREQNPITQGMRYGTTACVGCATFVVIAFVLIVLLVEIGKH